MSDSAFAARALLVAAYLALRLCAQVPNDDCAQAVPITEGVTPGSNVGATSSGLAGVCTQWSGGQPLQNEVWYSYLPSCSATALVSLHPADGGTAAAFFPMLASYSGTCTSGLTLLRCAGLPFSYYPRITFPVTAGTPVLIAVGGLAGGTGTFQLSVQCFTPIANDDCASATPITEGLISGTMSASTPSALGPFAYCSSAVASSVNDVWFSYVPSCTGHARISLSPVDGGGSSFTSFLAAFTASCGSSLSLLGCDGPTLFWLPPRLLIPVTAGVPVLIAIGSASPAPGTFTLVTICHPAPAHDHCAGAFSVGDGVTAGSTLGASTTPVSASCAPLFREVWYDYVPSCSGVATFSLCPADGGSSAFSPSIAAFPGSCAAPLVPINSSTGWTTALVRVSVTQGVPVRIAVGSTDDTVGAFQLAVSCGPAAVNDRCSGALPVFVGVNGPYTGVGAGAEAAPSSCGTTCVRAEDVWFAWTAPAAGFYTIPSCFAGFEVFDACGGNAVACGTSCYYGGSFSAGAGQSFLIRATGNLSDPATSFELTIRGPYELVISSPMGPGSLAVQSRNGGGSSPSFHCFTINAGSFPSGWFFGIDVLPDELAWQSVWMPDGLNHKYLDIAGTSDLDVIPSGVPPGITLHAVAVGHDWSMAKFWSAPVSYTTQ